MRKTSLTVYLRADVEAAADVVYGRMRRAKGYDCVHLGTAFTLLEALLDGDTVAVSPRKKSEKKSRAS